MSDLGVLHEIDVLNLQSLFLFDMLSLCASIVR